MELTKGMWYSCNLWPLTLAAKCNCIAIEHLYFDSCITTNLGYRECNQFKAPIYATFIEVPLSEIQQYLHDGHVDKEFVLKTKEMEEREIIGYKLKEACEQYLPALDKISFVFSAGNLSFVQGSPYYEDFKKAGVLDLWFEPIFKEKFKVGDWITIENSSELQCGCQGCPAGTFQVVEDTADRDYGLDKEDDGFIVKTNNGRWRISDEGVRLATPEEIKKTLVEEAVKRGFKEGVRVQSLIHNKELFCNNTINGFEYYPNYDKLHFGCDGGSCVVVYEKGRWAEILPSYPQIEINGYKGEFFDWGVKFGCAEIDKDVFIRLGQLGQGLNHYNKALESVTIGKGTFSKEQIKLIADYYLNKK